MQSSRSVAVSESEHGVRWWPLSARQMELTVGQILAWADAHHAAQGTWPDVRLMSGAGPVAGRPESGGRRSTTRWPGPARFAG